MGWKDMERGNKRKREGQQDEEGRRKEGVEERLMKLVNSISPSDVII